MTSRAITPAHRGRIEAEKRESSVNKALKESKELMTSRASLMCRGVAVR